MLMDNLKIKRNFKIMLFGAEQQTITTDRNANSITSNLRYQPTY